MALTINQILRHNIVAFEHMLRSLNMSYADFVLFGSDRMFQFRLDYLNSDEFIPHSVLDGIGRPYEVAKAKKILIATALDIPMTTLEEVPDREHDAFFMLMRDTMKEEHPVEKWYTSECFALRMRPLIEGSRKSLEGYWLYQTVRESLERVAHKIGATIEPKDKEKKQKDCTVITLYRRQDRKLRVQVKGVNSARHHAERAKILAKFADECDKGGTVALPILVGSSPDSYPDIPSLRYMRAIPMSVITSNPEHIDYEIMKMVSPLI